MVFRKRCKRPELSYYDLHFLKAVCLIVYFASSTTCPTEEFRKQCHGNQALLKVLMLTVRGFVFLSIYLSIYCGTVVISSRRDAAQSGQHTNQQPPPTLKYSLLICLLRLRSSFCQMIGCMSGQCCPSDWSLWFSRDGGDKQVTWQPR